MGSAGALPIFYFFTSTTFAVVKNKLMSFSEIIKDIQGCIISLQGRLDELKAMDKSTAQDILLTRQEAADMLGKSTRQLDRDCVRYGIPKVIVNGGIRIRKIELLKHMGLVGKDEAQGPDIDRSEFMQIYKCHR